MRAVEVEPGRVRLVDVEPAPLRPGDARVRVAACGLCGSDLHLLQGMILPRGVAYPVRPGHEVSGVVVERGDRASVELGARVALHPLAPCGTCPACRSGNEQRCGAGHVLGIHDPGGMADEVVWPADRLVAVGDLDLDQAALLPDAVATAYHALALAGVPEGGALGVVGAGGVGTHVLALARILVAGVRLAAVTRSEQSAARARSIGAHTIDGLAGAGRAVRDALGELDAVVDFSGAPGAPAEAVRMLRRGGRLVLGSIVDEPLDLATTITGVATRELQVLGAYSSGIADLRAVADLATSGRLDMTGSVGAVYDLTEAEQAFARAAGVVRAVLKPRR